MLQLQRDKPGHPELFVSGVVDHDGPGFVKLVDLGHVCEGEVKV